MRGEAVVAVLTRLPVGRRNLLLVLAAKHTILYSWRPDEKTIIITRLP